MRQVYDRYLGRRDKVRQNEEGIGNPRLKKHLARLEEDYTATFSEPDIEQHALLADRISDTRARRRGGRPRRRRLARDNRGLRLSAANCR